MSASSFHNYTEVATLMCRGILNQLTFDYKLVLFDCTRVAGLGRLSAGAKMAMKPFVKRVFTIFVTNASFLRVISNFRI